MFDFIKSLFKKKYIPLKVNNYKTSYEVEDQINNLVYLIDKAICDKSNKDSNLKHINFRCPYSVEIQDYIISSAASGWIKIHSICRDNDTIDISFLEI